MLDLAAFVTLVASAPNMGTNLVPFVDGQNGSTTVEPLFENPVACHVAVVSGWVLALFFMLFVLSYSYDFWFMKTSVLIKQRIEKFR